MSNKNSEIEKIAMERIERLLNQAREIYEKRPELAHRYVELAWRIKTKYNLRLPKKLKRKFCRKCRTFWIPGETCRVRLRSNQTPHLAITCKNCGYVKRIPYKKEERV